MTELVWLVIRQDGNDDAHRYRVGRFATREEAERVANRLGVRGGQPLYRIERADQPAS